MKCDYCHIEIKNFNDIIYHRMKKCQHPQHDLKYDKHIYELLYEKKPVEILPPDRCKTPPLIQPVDPSFDLIECELCHKKFTRRGLNKHRNYCLIKSIKIL